MVGITLEQAKLYCTWRTERVGEMILIESGYLEPNPNQTSEAQFTIERYLAGEYEMTLKQKEYFITPVFSVPTIEEWNRISGVESNYDNVLDSLVDY